MGICNPANDESCRDINQAAKEISVSYRKAWGYIKAMEGRLGVKLVECRKGGKNGGGAELTPEAKEFIYKYAELEDGVRLIVDKRFENVFQDNKY